MADGMREKTTNVGGVIKRIWYAMTGVTQGAELASVDDAGKFKCVSQQTTNLAGTGNRMVVADASGNLSAKNRQIKSLTVTDVDTGVGVTTNVSTEQIIKITNSAHVATFIVCPNYYAGVDVKYGVFGYAIGTVSAGNRFSFRLGGVNMEIFFSVIGGEIKLRRQTAGSTDVTIDMREL